MRFLPDGCAAARRLHQALVDPDPYVLSARHGVLSARHGHAGAPDAELLALAHREDRVPVTRDTDSVLLVEPGPCVAAPALPGPSNARALTTGR